MLPRWNRNPPVNITRTSHIILTSRDVSASPDFHTLVIGLVLTEETPNTLYLSAAWSPHIK